jgi:FAD/FMN-containing dehydrogenase
MAIDDLETELARALGATYVERGVAMRDIADREIGTPALVVRPRSAAEVATIVHACRRARCPLVVVGRRTAYWAPLEVDRAVALDLARVAEIEPGDDAWLVGAGCAVGTLDHALRAAGLALPIHPDAFGDTSIGAMVATACTSGIGMGAGSIDDAILGLEVVLGTGETITTGAMANASRPFVREAVSDLTGVFSGAQGTLGVITRIALAPRAAPWRVRLRTLVADDRILDVVALGRAWAGRYDTFRATRTIDASASSTFEADVWITSPVSSEEALARAAAAARDLDALAIRGVDTTSEPRSASRFMEPADGHDRLRARAALIGLDVNAPYASTALLLDVARELALEQRARGVPETRIALYLAPGFVNLGVHATVPSGVGYGLDDVRPFMEKMLRAPIVPYRAGRAWPRTTAREPDALRRALATACDPDRILHPGHPTWT